MVVHLWGVPGRRVWLKGQLKDAAICLSLANLLWLRAWSVALSETSYFLVDVRVPPLYFLSPAVGICAMALTFRIALLGMRAYPWFRARGTWVFLFLCGVAVNAVRNEIPALSVQQLHLRLGTTGLVITALFGSVSVLWMLAGRRDVMVRALRSSLLVFAPFFFVAAMRAGHAAYAEGQILERKTPGSLSHPRPGPRVVVVLFDAMDREIALGTPEGATLLPSFSRLQNEAVHFDAVLAPPGRRTLNSVPSMTLGRMVVDSKATDGRNLRLYYSDGTQGLWTEPPNLFRTARAEGVDSLVVGWAVPYCEIFASDLTDCSWRPYSQRPNSLSACLRRDAEHVLSSVPGLFRLLHIIDAQWIPGILEPDQTSYKAWHLNSYLAVHSRGLQGARDARYRLVYLHYPVPHPPIIFDRRVKRVSPIGGRDDLSNQILADQALGELRQAMENSGVWANSAVIVVSDHAPRHLPGERHSVLIVKPPYSSRPVAVTSEVSLVRFFDLVLGLLRGQVQTPEDVVVAVDRSP